jgi:hypothetical protein
MVRSVKTMHLSCTDTNIVSKWTKTRFHTTQVTYEFHRMRPKLFMSWWYVQCKPCTYLCTDTSTMSKQTKMRFHTTHVTYKFHRVRPKLIMSLWYVQCKPCTYLVSRLALSPNGPNRTPLDPRHLGVPWGAFKMIYEPMVRLTQTEHLSCTDANTVSKRTKTRFHTTHITYEFHRARPKLFMSLWYVQCKPCTYLASRLALSPNGPNRAPPDPRHLEVPSGASKMIYEPMVPLTQTEHPSCTDANTVWKQIETRFHMTNVTKEFHRVPPILFLSLWYVRRKPCTNLEPTLIMSQNISKRDGTWPTSPRRSIRCLQYYFRANSTFDANCAPILHQE